MKRTKCQKVHNAGYKYKFRTKNRDLYKNAPEFWIRVCTYDPYKF